MAGDAGPELFEEVSRRLGHAATDDKGTGTQAELIAKLKERGQLAA